MKGRCKCGAVSFEMTAEPMIVHACHCSWCQGESGKPFVTNAVIETLSLDFNCEVELTAIPSASGRGQEIVYCPICRETLWSHYPNAMRRVAFVRTSVLEDPAAYPPDVHIFTSTKHESTVLAEGTPAFAEFYNAGEVWSPETQERWRTVMAGITP
jgi:hypothetical protein